MRKLLVIAPALLLAACGSGGSDTATSSAPGSSLSTSTSATTSATTPATSATSATSSASASATETSAEPTSSAAAGPAPAGFEELNSLTAAGTDPYVDTWKGDGLEFKSPDGTFCMMSGPLPVGVGVPYVTCGHEGPGYNVVNVKVGEVATTENMNAIVAPRRGSGVVLDKGKKLTIAGNTCGVTDQGAIMCTSGTNGFIIDGEQVTLK